MSGVSGINIINTKKRAIATRVMSKYDTDGIRNVVAMMQSKLQLWLVSFSAEILC
ncbi:MAG TPA: hypothetical protein IGS40_13245 [Trichormus sp. M33_DOE_039]|nr:hypothetical protein [Trichormus sp. M33_DOE_039]